MAWKPNSPDQIAAFERAFAGRAGLERKSMFGCPGVFSRGHMVAVLQADQWVLRLSETDGEALVQIGGAPWRPMPNRPPAKDKIVLPAAVVADPKKLGTWIQRALRFASQTPPKKKVQAGR